MHNRLAVLAALLVATSNTHAQLCTPTLLTQFHDTRVGQLVADGDILYAVGTTGLSVYLATDPASPGLIATLPLGGASTGDAVLIGDTLYASNGDGMLHVVDVIDPAHPVDFAQLATNVFFENLVVVGPWLAQDNTLGEHQIIDPGTLTIVGTIPGANGTNLFPSDDGRLWALAAGEVRVYEIDNAGQATLAASFAAAVSGTGDGIVRDGLLFLNRGENLTDTTLSIIDVADIQNPVTLSTITVGGGLRGETTLEGSQVFVGTDSFLTIVDFSVPASPFVVARIVNSTDSVQPHGTAIFTAADTITPALRVLDRSGCPTLPVIIAQPASVLVQNPGDAAEFTVAALLANSYRWTRNGVELDDGPEYSGVNSNALTVHATSATSGLFQVIVSNNQGDVASVAAGLAVNQPCRADFNSDGLVDFFDVQAFLNEFAGGCDLW